jgi:hypothetical protein
MRIMRAKPVSDPASSPHRKEGKSFFSVIRATYRYWQRTKKSPSTFRYLKNTLCTLHQALIHRSDNHFNSSLRR